jgi:long-chain acyl-CoA synthetase
VYHDFRTLPELLRHIRKNGGRSDALNYRCNGSWRSLSTRDFCDRVNHLALALAELRIKKGESVGLMAPSSPQWLVIDLAIMIAGGVSVPIYVNTGSQNLNFEIEDSQMRYLFTTPAGAKRVRRSPEGNLKQVFTFDCEDPDPRSSAGEGLIKRGKKIAERNGELFEKLIERVEEDDLATLIYTSGSTGLPKGVELTHKNLVSQLYGSAQRFPLIPERDRMLSVLPLAHVMERMVLYYYLSSGSPVYFGGDVMRILGLLREVKPTVVTLVPRMLEQIRSRMKAGLEETAGLRRRMETAAFEHANTRDLNRWKGFRQLIFDRLLYSRLRTAVGGQIRLIISGSASLPRETGRFFYNIGLPIFEGYGLTESSPVLTANYPGANKPGTVGKAYPGVEIRVASDGEILARGPNIMRSYRNNRKATARALNSGGWLHTGDLGSIDADGFLTIQGRKKDLLKTSAGQYVTPASIERDLCRSDLIDIAVVIAEGKRYVTCLLFPDFDCIEDLKGKNGYRDLSTTAFIQTDFVRMQIAKHVASINKTLDPWQQIARFAVIPTVPTIDQDLLTPSKKIRRHVIEEKFQSEIVGLYAGSL